MAQRIGIIGGGIVGMATAYALVMRGAEVALFEANPAPARATSFANATLLTPGHGEIWNEPGAFGHLLGSLFARDPVVRVRSGAALSPSFLDWGWRFLRACGADGVRHRNRVSLDLTRHSAALTRVWARAIGQPLDAAPGAVYLARDPDVWAVQSALANRAAVGGMTVRRFDDVGLRALDPAFAASNTPYAGAYKTTECFAADPHRFAKALAASLTDRAALCFDTKVDHIARHGHGWKVFTGGVETVFDTLVLCPGPWGEQITQWASKRLPIAQATGYSLTVPLRTGARVPQHGGLDADHLVAFAPLVDEDGAPRLRVTSYAHFAGMTGGMDQHRFIRHRTSMDSLFPGLIDWDGDLRPWAGRRPMSPDGLPTVGPVPDRPGLWVNAGHGYLGWTLAVGTADRLTRQLLDGDTDTITPDLAWR
jgi:D-amino-acid dehydrogenase